jgi:KDO2-lipid IV(A) lauroyltransferase
MAKTKKHALLQWVEYLLYRSVAALVRSASDEAVLRWGARLGTVSRRLLRRRDRLAMQNLRAVFPERDPGELRRILDECWRHFGRELLMYVQIQNVPLAEIAARCEFENVQILDDAVARGRGVVLITAHWGGWELAGLALMTLVGNVRMVARKLDNEYLERDLVRLRSQTGAEVIDRRNAARALLRALAENAVLVLLPDQAVQEREGVLVPFLGRPAWTTPAPAKLALRAKSTIVFGFCIVHGTRHSVVFQEAIHIDELSEAERDPVALTTRINEVISRRITERPEHWLWMHDRWKGTGGSGAV